MYTRIYGINNKDVWELLPRDIHTKMLSNLLPKTLLEVESACNNWQFIIKSLKFYMLQIDANFN